MAPELSITCAENIALLYILNSVPVLPSRNQVDHIPGRQGDYTLSFAQERSLTGTLAFLASLKDGPEHIPAVCIEEDDRINSLKVLIAVNKAKPNDGKEVLQALKKGFEETFALLAGMSDERNNLVTQVAVFSSIISMCRARILCRLRFTPNSRNAPKQPIKELLHEAIRSLQSLEKQNKLPSALLSLSESFIEKAKVVMKLIDTWTRHRVSTRLEELVDGISQLWRVGRLQHLFDAIPNKIMAPTWRKNLLNTLSKVARYREAARFLFRAARKIPLVRCMRVVLVQPPQEAFQKNPSTQFEPSLVSTVARIRESHGHTWSLSQICRVIKVNETEAERQFKQQTQKTLEDGKIHAEIQLIAYCELKKCKLFPRVVCSTKDACFLCNIFIRTSGMIYTPRSHGRLYPGWRLPFSSRLIEIQQRFNQELAHQIHGSITTLVSMQHKTVYPDPCESTLLTLPVSASTVYSSTSPVATHIGREPSFRNQSSYCLGGKEPDVISSIPNPPPLSNNIHSVVAASLDDTSPHSLNHAASIFSPESATFDRYKLAQGKPFTMAPNPHGVSPICTTSFLEVQIEFPIMANFSSLQSDSSRFTYSIEWLTNVEAQKFLRHSPSLNVDADLLTGETMLHLDDQECFWITARGHTVRIQQSGAACRDASA